VVSNNTGLTKEQRRQQFELKVKQEEIEAASKAAASEEAALLADQQEKELTQELKWIFDKTLNQWMQCYVPVNSVKIVNEHNLMPPPPPPLPPPTIQASYHFDNFDLNPTSIINSNSNDLNNHINNLNLTESNLQDLKQAVRLFMPENKEAIITPLSPIGAKSLKKLVTNQMSTKLPPNWKCKKNKRGKIYYLNLKTKKSQWHFPRSKPTVNNQKPSIIVPDESLLITSTTNEPLISSNDKKEEKIDDLSSSSSFAISTNESSSNTFKLYKDQFRDKLSKLIIKLLEYYLKEDCKYGHIRNTDDFKHLARKFTHTIMEKELSRVTKLEELDLNKRVKMKTEEYINQYMNKFKNGYSRKNDVV
jgi:hypothetical protein